MAQPGFGKSPSEVLRCGSQKVPPAVGAAPRAIARHVHKADKGYVPTAVTTANNGVLVVVRCERGAVESHEGADGREQGQHRRVRMVAGHHPHASVLPLLSSVSTLVGFHGTSFAADDDEDTVVGRCHRGWDVPFVSFVYVACDGARRRTDCWRDFLRSTTEDL